MSETQTGAPGVLEGLGGHFSGLSRDVLLYGLGGTVSRLVSLLLAPILTRILSVADYGQLDLISVSVNFLILLLGFNLTSGMWRYYYELRDDQEGERKRLVSSTYWFIAAVAVPLTVGAFWFAPQYARDLFGSRGLSTAVRLAVISIPAQMYHTMFSAMQRMRKRPVGYLALNLGNMLTNFALVLVFVVVLRWGIPGIFLAQLVAFTATAVVGGWMGRDLLTWAFSRSWLARIAAYALPQFPAVFITFFLGYSNRFFLNHWAGAQAVGYLSVANKIATVVVVMSTSFRLAWDPFALSVMSSDRAREIYARGLSYFLVVMLVAGGVLTIFAEEALRIIAPPQYLPAAGLVGILVARHVLQGANNVVGISITISKQTIYASLAVAVAAVANVVANLVLTHPFGARGAALAELTGFLVAFGAYLVVSRRLFPVPWDYGALVRLGTAFGALVVLSLVFQQWRETWVVEVPLKLVAVSVFGVVVVSALTRKERAVSGTLGLRAVRWTQRKLARSGP